MCYLDSVVIETHRARPKQEELQTMNRNEANKLGHRLYALLEAIAYGKIEDKEIHALLDIVLETKPRDFRTMMTMSRENRREIEVIGFIEVE